MSKDECIIFLLHLGEICTRVLLRVHKTHCNVYKHFLNAINVHLRQKKSHDDNKLHEKDQQTDNIELFILCLQLTQSCTRKLTVKNVYFRAHCQCQHICIGSQHILCGGQLSSCCKNGVFYFSSNCHPFFHGRQHLVQGSNGVFF